MEAVTIIETAKFNELISSIESLKEQVASLLLLPKEKIKKFLTVKETAEYLNKNPQWVYKKKKDIGFTTIGGEIVFPVAGIDEYIMKDYYRKY
ncbi:MAG: helix-turn-helix domain-containing protein [Sphingobacteriaceae bacterium]|nr:helix-turn-helix domain-containing protein [Sphingobacteriaceae bacterium]